MALKQHYINGWIFWSVQVALSLFYIIWAVNKEQAAKKEGIKLKDNSLWVYLLSFILFAAGVVVNYNLFPKLHNRFLQGIIAVPFSLL
jgi:4-hydroxybenzoate polyprenyltransferase